MTDVRTVAYGREALDALTDVVASAKRGDPMAPVTVLAANPLAGTTLRRHLARGVGDRPGIAGFEVTTVRRLAERLALPHIGSRRPAVRAVVGAAIRAALAADPGPFAEVAGHPGTVQAIARAYTELRELDPPLLADIAGTSDLTASVIAIHDAVRAALRDDWYDERDLLDAADPQAARLGSCVLYLPQDLTPSEARFLARLRGVHQVAMIVGVTRTDRGDAGPLRAVGLADGPAGGVAVADRVLTASDADDEVRAVVRDLVGRLSATPAHRIAVLYSSRVPYARLLHEQLTAAGIATNGPGVRPLEERAVARLLLEVLALADTDVPRADLFRALANAPARDFTGQRVPLSAWERASRSAGIVGGDDWELRLCAYVEQLQARAAAERAAADPREWLADRHTRDAATTDELGAFARRLRTELQTAGRLTTWSALADWARDLFAALVGDPPPTLPDEEKLAVAAITVLLDQLAGLDAISPTATFSAFRDVVRGELEANIPRTGRFGDGVLVAPISTAVGLDLDLAYVVGLAEDVYPGRTQPDALLPESVRLLTDGALPTPSDRLQQRYRHLLVSFAAGTETVASFPRGDLRRSTVRLPSRWLLPTLRDLAHDHALPATEWDTADYAGGVVNASSYAGALLGAAVLGTDQEWRTRAAAAGTLADPDVDAALVLIRARAGDRMTRFDGLLSASDGLPDYAVDDISIAPTTLEKYAECPHGFFVRRLLGVEPLEQPEDSVTVSAAEIGTLVHDVMDRLVSGTANLPAAGAPWTPEHRRQLEAIVVESMDLFEQQGLSGHPRLWAGERLRIARDIERMLDADDEWRREGAKTVVASEMPFGIKGEPPVSIPVPGGRVLMRGSADKVDVGSDGTVWVTDIKTGSSRTFKPIKTEPFVGGTKLQLPVYAAAARERFGSPGSPVLAGYWFVRRDPGRLDIPVDDDLAAQYGEVIGTLVRSIAAGLFPPKAPDEPDFRWTQCPYCNPDGLGHGEVRERYERKRTDPVLADLVELIDPAAVTP